ncbi:MAG TPA: 6-phosphofructokinase [Bacillota bacterium]|nr:6-phosphofructokinase [Bacillota bacterium]HPL52811.1 6-phosphofructokinase [Bacillota bacterium]
MAALKGNCLIAQSGGPTAVINASACGVIQEAFKSGEIDKVFGALHGVVGILNENLFIFNDESPEEIELMKFTPASALGSCRYKLKSIEANEKDYKRIIDVFEAHNIRYFFYIGGNDSMDTASKVNQYAERVGYQLKSIGVPKTVDNDLPITDHTPGFGSAAKFIATSIKEVGLDARVYNYPTVTICELMGRNAGWITASSALAKKYEDDAPHLIYLPEVPFSFEKFGNDVKSVLDKYNYAVIAFSEGIKTKEGRYVSEIEDPNAVKDAFGHVQLGGASEVLERYVLENICKKVRTVNYSTIQRSAAHWASLTDNEESFMCGRAAVEYAIEGHTGKMVGMSRSKGEEYKCETQLIDLEDVANQEKKIPIEWISKSGDFVEQPILDYIRPLITGEVKIRTENGLPRYARLQKKLVEKKLEKWDVK